MYAWQQTVWQAEGFWSIHTYRHQNVMKVQKPSQGDGFWVSSAKSPHRQGGFETHAYSRQLIVMLVCMFWKVLCLWRVFQNSSPCGGFLSAKLVCMYLKVCMFQKSCPCGEFFKTAHPVEGFRLLSWYVCMCNEPHRQRSFGYLDHPPYPPSQILKNWIKRQILKGFRKESDLVSRAWISADIHTSLANIHTSSANIYTCLANIHTYIPNIHVRLFKHA